MKRHFLDFVALHPNTPQTKLFFDHVREHPQLCIPAEETHYFSSEKINQGPEWYEAHFKKCKPGAKRGEIATTYLAAIGVASRLAREYPDARACVLITDPIEALAARFAEATAGVALAPTLEEFLERQPTLLEQYKFGKQLTTFSGYYSPVDLLVMTLDDVRERPASMYKNLFEHLDVDKNFLPEVLTVLSEEEETHPSWWSKRLRIDRLRARRRARRLEKAAAVFPPAKIGLSAKERVLLTRYYEHDVQQLSALLHRDLALLWHYPSSRAS